MVLSIIKNCDANHIELIANKVYRNSFYYLTIQSEQEQSTVELNSCDIKYYISKYTHFTCSYKSIKGFYKNIFILYFKYTHLIAE